MTPSDDTLNLLSDEPLQDAGSLLFDARPIVERVWDIVLNCPTPYHIGLFAPWGLGKSTVLDSVQSLVEKSGSKSVRVVRLNAWKYRHDSLRRKFLLDTAQVLSDKSRDALKQRIYQITPSLREHAPWKWANLVDGDWWAGVGRTLRIPFVVFLVTVLFGGIQALSELKALSALFCSEGLWLWTRKVGGMLGFPLISFVIPYLANNIGKISVDHGDAVHISGIEQFEEQFSRALKKLGKNERLLVMIDELDRCSPEQVLEVLETVKTFMNQSGCVFLIACDRSVIEDALKESLHPQGRRVSLYLDKIFQLTIQLPPVLPPDIRGFALLLLRGGVDPKVPGLAHDMVATGAFDILIRPVVNTPRRVKRLLNDFQVRYAMARAREKDWEEDERLTRNLAFFAKMTVIHSEFPEFVQHLMQNSDLMAWLELVRTEQLDKLEDYQAEACKVFFQTDANGDVDWSRPAPGFEELIQFLGQTWQYQATGIQVRRHLYLARDQQGRAIGDSLLARVLSLAESAHFAELSRVIRSVQDPDQVLEFVVNQISHAYGARRQNLLLSLLHMAEHAREGTSGTIAAAHALSSDLPLLEQMDQDYDVSLVIPFLPNMTTVAKSRWLTTLEAWMEEDPEGRGERIFATGYLQVLHQLHSQNGEKLAGLLSRWIQTPHGQASVTERLAEFLVHPGTKNLVEGIIEALSDLFLTEMTPDDEEQRRQDPTAIQVQLIRTIVDTLGAETVVQRHSTPFWTIMKGLLYPSPSFEVNWVIDTLHSIRDRIPETQASAIIGSAASALTEKSPASVWNQVLSLAEFLIERYGTSVTRGEWHLITDLLQAIQPIGLEPFADFVIRHWAKWDEDAQGEFHDKVLKYLYGNNSPSVFRLIAKVFRQTEASATQERKVSFFTRTGEILASHWSDPKKVQAVSELLGELRPFDLPPDSKTTLVQVLTTQAFHSDRNPLRVHVLGVLIQLHSELAPGAIQNTLTQVHSLYLQSETNDDRFNAGCQGIGFHAHSLRGVSGLVHPLIDLVINTPVNSARYASTRTLLHAMCRELPWSLLSGRQDQIEQFLTSLPESDMESVLTTLDALASASASIDYAKSLVAIANRFFSSDRGLARLSQWITTHLGHVSIDGLIDAILSQSTTIPLLSYVAKAGGMSLHANLTNSLITRARQGGTGLPIILDAIASLSSLDNPQVGRSILELFIHLLTGTSTEREAVISSFPKLRHWKPLTRTDQNRLRDALLGCYAQSASKLGVGIVRALVNFGLMSRSAKKAILEMLPESETHRQSIQELLNRR